MRTTRIFLSLAIVVVMFSCKKEVDKGRVDSPNFGEVHFDFSSDKQVDYSLSLVSSNIDGVHRVNLYQEWTPSGGEKLICSRLISKDKAYDGEVAIPAFVKVVYAEVTTSYGSSYMQRINIGQKSSIKVDLGMVSARVSKKSTMTSPDCSSGCTISYLNHSSNLTINDDNEVICIVNGLSDKHLTVQGTGSVVRLCGTGTLKNVNIGAGNKLIVTDGADITFSSLDVKLGAKMVVHNATVVINEGNWTLNGEMINNGDITANGNAVVNGNGELTNNGSINVAGNFNNNNILDNQGQIHADGHIHFNGSSKTINHCKITTADHLQINDSLWNYGYIGADLNIHFNGGSYTEMISGSTIEGESDAVINSVINGVGVTSLVKIANNTNINGAGVLEGNVELCTVTSTVNGSVLAPASLSCNVVNSSSGCSQGGSTPPPPPPPCQDLDNDGVCDAIDCMPSDPTVAVCDCYPNCDEYATLAFEDLWPYAGDYDFNDLVMNYNYAYFADADNKVVRMNPSFLIRAIGASFQNGFGFQMEVAPASISSVTGQIMTEGILTFNPNGTESDQSKATIMVFDNANTAFSAMGSLGMQNTRPNLAYKSPDTIFMTIDFSSPQDREALGEAPYNPFIFVKQVRSHEVHLMHHEPTDKMDLSLFGRGADASDPDNAIYYDGVNGLPWALNIPVEFDYPAENNDIRDTYLHFGAWAASAGISYPDWYLDLAGYRNAALIY